MSQSPPHRFFQTGFSTIGQFSQSRSLTLTTPCQPIKNKFKFLSHKSRGSEVAGSFDKSLLCFFLLHFSCMPPRQK